MITLTVTSLNGEPGDAGLSAQFDELGGAIGRADTNQLVLPDPDRVISRVHAQVVYRGGTYAIVDRGSNPILVNGQPVGSGREMPIKTGDKVQIGGFLMDVQEQAAAATAHVSDDPFADLLGPAAGSGTAAGMPPAAELFDPLAPAGASQEASLGAHPRPPPVRADTPASAGGIPDDWDPFAPDPVAKQPSTSNLASWLGRPGAAGSLGLESGAAAPPSLIPDLSGPGPGNDHSLDALFGLKASGGGDPLANSPLDAPMAAPNMAASHDPMRSLGSAPRASAQTAPDDSSDLHRPYLPPPGAVLSWDAPTGNGHTVIRPSAPAADPAPETASMLVPARISPPAPSRPTAGASPESADVAALLAAFREGLGAPHLELDALTPELMRRVGQLLHEATRGTVDLLMARATLKREVRAAGTLLGTQNNNPLEFSPNVDVALQHLLSRSMRGFMEPASAMRQAYVDLRAHQFGVIAGMRAALAGVLDRFRPSEFEVRSRQRTGWTSLLPGSRKAAMWDAFTEHHARIGAEAADDFHSLFGNAFLKAYDEHVAPSRKDQP